MAPRRARQTNSTTAPQNFQATFETPFPRFRLLPQELQNIIWQTAVDCVKPRIVEVQETVARNTRQSSYLQKRQFTSPCPIPGVLQACRASRHLALKRWRLSFAARYQDPKIFFDFSNDTLYFDGVFADMSKFVKNVDRTDRDTVKNLAMVALLEWDREYFHDGYTLCFSLREDFPAVTQLIFSWVDRDNDDEPEESQLRQMRLQQMTSSTQRITMWKKPDPQSDWAFEAFTMDEVKECCEERGWTCPEMKLVESYTADLSTLEYDEDDRNMQKWHLERKWKEWGLADS